LDLQLYVKKTQTLGDILLKKGRKVEQ